MNEGQKIDNKPNYLDIEEIDSEKLDRLIPPGTLLWGAFGGYLPTYEDICSRGILPPKKHKNKLIVNTGNPNCVCLAMVSKINDPKKRLLGCSSWSRCSFGGPVFILDNKKISKMYEGKICAVGNSFQNGSDLFSYDENTNRVCGIPVGIGKGKWTAFYDEVDITFEEETLGITLDMWEGVFFSKQRSHLYEEIIWRFNNQGIPIYIVDIPDRT